MIDWGGVGVRLYGVMPPSARILVVGVEAVSEVAESGTTGETAFPTTED
jgi:hypothetical protein